MTLNRTNVLLAVGLVITLGASWGTGVDHSLRGLEFAPQMAHSARYNAFSPNPNFPGSQTLRAPEPGTIARGQPPLHYAATPADAVRAGLELTNPVAVADATALAQGTTVFLNFCQPCHGAGGRGDGPVTQRGFPPPPSLLAQHALDLKDGQLFHILTYGQGNMAPYASQLSRDDRWRVILYVRSLQAAPAPPAGGAKP